MLYCLIRADSRYFYQANRQYFYQVAIQNGINSLRIQRKLNYNQNQVFERLSQYLIRVHV